MNRSPERRPIRVLVAGGTGAVGRHVCREVIRTLGAQALVVGDHDPDRGRRFARSLSDDVSAAALDVDDRASIERAVDGVDAVVVAVRQSEPNVQGVCTRLGVYSVDVVPDTALARSALRDGAAVRLDERVSGLVAAGLIPGLSGLMARHAIEEGASGARGSRARALHVSLLQRKHGTAGAAGIADMLGLFARPVQHEGTTVRGFTRSRLAPFPHPFGDRPVRLVAFSEAADIRRHFRLDRVDYWTAFDDAAFNRAIGALNRLGVLDRFRAHGGGTAFSRFLARRLASGKNAPPGVDETVALTAEADDGTVVRLTVPSDYGGTAMAAVAMARALLADGAPQRGVEMPFQRFTLHRIVELIASADVRVDVTQVATRVPNSARRRA